MNRRPSSPPQTEIFEVRITVTLDTTELVDRMDRAAADMLRGLRSAVDKTARSARRQAIAEAARDEGVTVREAGKGQPLVKGSTQFSLSASWTVKPTFVNILRTSGATQERGEGLHASTFRITGGRSASLSAQNAFRLSVANADGGLAFVRTRHGKGTHRGGGIRAISAEMTRTAMGQEDGAARRLWQRVAQRELKAAANAAVQRALDGAGASLDRGFD